MDAFVDVVLGRLLATSVQTVLLTAVVWTLCRWLPRLSPVAQCWLWWLVALQALAGLFAAPIQLPWLPRAALSGATPYPDGNTIAVGAQELATRGGVLSWSMGLFALWICGVTLAGWLTLRQWMRVRALLRTSTPCVDSRLLQVLASASESRGLRRAPPVRLSREIDSPIVVGHVSPVLLLPTRVALSDAELDMALAHELTHLRRGDLWWGCVPSVARHLFFFHPLTRLAEREYDIAREAGCDAAVMELDRHSRRDYGRLLLRLGASSDSDAGLAVASPTFHALNRRLIMLQNTSFLPRAGSLSLLVLVAAVGVMPLRLVEAAAAPVASSPSGTAPAAAQAPPKVYSGERMSANFEEIPTRKLLQLIGDTSGRNILIHDAVTGTVTMHINNMPWDQVLDIVLRAKGLDMRVQDNVIIVAPAQALAAEEEAALAAARKKN